MVPHPSITRRRLLRGVVASLAGLSGCGTGYDPPPDARRDPGRPENVATEPPHRMVRNPADEPFAYLAPPTDGSDDGTSRKTRGFITSDETARRLRFDADLDGVDAARSIVTATDFSAESVYFLHYPVDACFRLTLCYVTWSTDEIDIQFGRAYRPPDVACDVDDRDTVAAFIRLPDALDPDAISGFGVGSGSRCRLPPDWRTATPTATVTSTSATPRGKNGP